MGKLFASALEVVPILGLHRILDRAGDGVIDAEHGTLRALRKLHLAGGISTQAAGGGRLSLTPCLGRAGLASRVRGRDAVGNGVDGGVNGRMTIRFSSTIGIAVGGSCGRTITGVGFG